MQWTADIFLTLRYLRPKRTLISVITLLSVLGPMLGVALLIIVTSVMSGFDRDIRNSILGMQAHLQVSPGLNYLAVRHPAFAEPRRIMAALTAVGAQGSPLIEGPILIQIGDEIAMGAVRGILPESEAAVTDVCANVRGRFELTEGEILVGDNLARQRGIRLGDKLLLHSPARLAQNIEWGADGRLVQRDPEEVYLPEEATVVGIFSTGLHEYDTSMFFLHLDQAADLFGYEWGSATAVHAKVPDPFQMEALVEALQERLPGCAIVTWKQANRRLFGALRVEKNLMMFLLTFIVIVAAFGISGTLITVAVQKTREIGILKAIGMTSGMVARVFLLLGTIIGLVGTALGTGLGLIVIRHRTALADLLSRAMDVEVFPAEVYNLEQIPALVTGRDIAVIISLALLICAVAALLPALYASLLSPVKALQDEN